MLRKILGKRGLHPSALKHLSVPENMKLDVPLSEATYIVFDTELTGLNLKKDSVVSIGALKMFGRRIDIGSTYYRVIAPETELTGKSVIIHGITPSEASVCPTIDKLLPEFLDFCADGILIGHFVAIDLAFINKEMERLFGFPLQSPSLDTQMVYTWIRHREEQTCAFHAGIKEQVDLFSLAQKYSIQVSDAHNALNDAFVTAQLFQRFIQSLEKYGIHSLRDLLGTGRPRKI
ncbi:MAG: 3'-5' exonuclease [Thermodesulfovibrionales bacterium]|nr:3'-5' exonuclease [Thermodesulfovibrionales bacterium]